MLTIIDTKTATAESGAETITLPAITLDQLHTYHTETRPPTGVTPLICITCHHIVGVVNIAAADTPYICAKCRTALVRNNGHVA